MIPQIKKKKEINEKQLWVNKYLISSFVFKNLNSKVFSIYTTGMIILAHIWVLLIKYFQI